jgi:hypothetical protein
VTPSVTSSTRMPSSARSGIRNGWTPLVGKDLVCYCAPRRCHAETLLRLANFDRHAVDKEEEAFFLWYEFDIGPAPAQIR